MKRILTYPTSKLRISFLAGTLGQGGAERQLFYMVDALSQIGVQCQVLSFDDHQFYHRRLVDIGIPVISVGRFKYRLARLFLITRVVSQWHPHIIQASHLYTNLYAASAAKLIGAKSIGANRGSVFHETKPLGYLGTLSLKFPDAVIANSMHACKAIKEGGYRSSSVYLLDNVVDCNYFHPVKRAQEQEKVRLLAVGRLSELKRQDLLLRAVAEAIHLANCEFEVILAGDGPRREFLETLAVDLGIAHLVHFWGAQDDMSVVYQSADILVHTSKYEGTPNVILEAMASGLPVITTQAGAIPGLVENAKTGYVATGEDVKSIAKAIVDLALHPQQRTSMGKEARERIKEDYSLSSLSNHLMTIYSRVLNQRLAHVSDILTLII